MIAFKNFNSLTEKFDYKINFYFLREECQIYGINLACQRNKKKK